MPLRAIFRQTGNPSEALQIEEFEPPRPGPGELLLAMLAAPVNPADLNFVEGRYGVKASLPSPAGFEGAGVVEAVGEGAGDFKPGDLVLPEGPGTWATHLICKAQTAIRIPGGLSALSATQAATLKVNPSTAYRMLRDFVTLRTGEWVLQNAGNSAVGRHVIQLCKAAGWRSASLVRRQELIPELQAIGADAVVLDDDNAPATLRGIFNGAPPRLALNAVGGESLLRLAKVCAHGAVVVTYGGMSKKPVTIPTGMLIFNDLSFRGFWLTRWFRSCPAGERDAMFEELARLAAAGRLSVPVDAEYSLRDLPAAVSRAAEPSRAGKVLLKLAEAGEALRAAAAGVAALLPALLAAGSLLASAPLPARSAPLAAEAGKRAAEVFPVSTRFLPGEGREGQCLSYAYALMVRLFNEGQKGHLVVFRWHTASGGGVVRSGSHAIVVARGADGNLYAADNLSPSPRPVAGETPYEWARAFTGQSARVVLLAVRETRDKPGRRAGPESRSARVVLPGLLASGQNGGPGHSAGAN